MQLQGKAHIVLPYCFVESELYTGLALLEISRAILKIFTIEHLPLFSLLYTM
jgi:hypothetical protein